ncbi:hypothetical protein IscW_ISCW016934 [Ixodes scapularis]|uniref:Uncharacterized protein n=1 Tax=Ixodes scapularis TaxID=6945 RepID=B7PDG8_IXOSC|nr:hypothetical protein IscW_ISCW016934 [Ixodes scapularis]|eukprot:XP_002410802.1 hypothetical protein IscW_ISCW016934 [Ixodes scapularis]
MLFSRRSTQIRRRGLDCVQAALEPDCSWGPQVQSEVALKALDFVRWHPNALGGRGQNLRQALGLTMRCFNQTDLTSAALEAAAAILVHHHAELRDELFDLHMSAFHLLASSSAAIRHKALGIILLLLDVDPLCTSRELLYLVRWSERLQRLGAMLAFKRVVCKGSGLHLLPMDSVCEFFECHADDPDDLIRNQALIGLDLLRSCFGSGIFAEMSSIESVLVSGTESTSFRVQDSTLFSGDEDDSDEQASSHLRYKYS